jgi:hypothetical protein
MDRRPLGKMSSSEPSNMKDSKLRIWFLEAAVTIFVLTAIFAFYWLWVNGKVLVRLF